MHTPLFCYQWYSRIPAPHSIQSIQELLRNGTDMKGSEKVEKQGVEQHKLSKATCNELPMHRTIARQCLIGIMTWTGWGSLRLRLLPPIWTVTSHLLNTFYNVHSTKEAPRLHPSIEICWSGSRAKLATEQITQVRSYVGTLTPQKHLRYKK